MIENARIFTGANFVPALAFADSRVVAVGETSEVRAAVQNPVTWDLEGRFVLPGFIDLHVHVLEAGLNQRFCPLTADATLVTYEQELADCAALQTENWVRAAGMPASVLEEGERVIDVLDRAVPDRPTIVLDDLGHAVFANSRALELAGIRASDPDPQGGVYVRDRDGLVGALLESAQQRLRDAARPSDAVMDEALRVGLAELARLGVTTVSDAGGYWTRGHPAVWQRVNAQGELTARAFNALYVYPDRPYDAQLDSLRAAFVRGDDRLAFDTAKLYVDGILSLETAFILEPYADPLDPMSPRGFEYFGVGELERYARDLDAAGFRLHFHAVGDAGVRRALDSVEALASVSRIPRTTHNYMIHPQDVARFPRLGVAVDFQIGEVPAADAFFTTWRPSLGARADRLIPVRDLIDAGAHVTLSSDWDADALSPFGIIQRSVGRSRQSVPDVQTAVRLLTDAPARALGKQGTLGRLDPGAFADLVVVDRDIFNTPTEQIGATEVVMTVVGGEVVYER